MPTPPLKNTPPEKPAARPLARSSSTLWLLGVLALVLMFLVCNHQLGGVSEISYGMFRKQLDKSPPNIAKVEVQGTAVAGEFVTPPPDPSGKKDRNGHDVMLERKFVTSLPAGALADRHLDDLLLEKVGDNYTVVPASDGTRTLLTFSLLMTVALFAGLWFLLRRSRDSMFGGLMGGFSKSTAKRYEMGDRPVTFDDVAGLEGVKRELQEIVEFLKNPEKFQRLGGRVPRGVLLMGPPGAGKTLLARAVAGEAGVPFYSVSGSEFMQMFVGVGAGRVRDLFETAKKHAPAMLFIDEIDAVGRHRGTGLGGSQEEREQTLNQILSEMDGFTQTESVIIMAATNRPDMLDPALLRPGRFDRHIVVDRPSYAGRLAIFKVHSRDVPLGADVDLERLAAGTVGLTGADIRNLVNEAALWASRHDKEQVEMADFEYARDKVLMGVKRDEVLTGKEKSMTAYHESGHALLAWLVPGIDHLHKVSIIPRGRALGATQLLPEEDRFNISEGELQTRLLFLLGGRAAEKLVFDEFSAGAEDDLNKATLIARRMVTHWGMSERLGPVAFRDSEEHPFLGKEISIAAPRQFSEHTAQVIDEEVIRILRAASDRALELLGANRDKLDLLAHTLEKEETLDEPMVTELLGPGKGLGAGG
ncbi:MAG: ATP-dependent zinc metalloprotease FtsH [Thermoguttaceae bacterium]